MPVEKGVFTLNTTTGAQTVTLANGSLTPVWLIVWATLETADGITNGDGIMSIGFGTRDGGTTQQAFNAVYNQDGAATSVTEHSIDSDMLLQGLSSNNATEATAQDYSITLTSFGAGQFVINVADAPATAVKVHYMVGGGSEFSAARVGKTVLTASTTPQNITIGTGFGQADLIFTLSNSFTSTFSSSQDARIMLGASKGLTERRCGLFGMEQGSNNMALASWMKDRAVLFFGSTPVSGGEGDIDHSTPTDGFQLQFAVNPTFAFQFAFLAIKGSFTATIGSSTMPTTAGGSPQNLALASGSPSAALLWSTETPAPTAGVGTIETGSTTGADLGGFVLGGTDGTHEGFAGIVDIDAAGTSAASRMFSTTKALARHIGNAAGATLDAEADSSISGSNVVLTWNDLASDAAEFNYLIFGAPATDATVTAPALDGTGDLPDPVASSPDATVVAPPAAGTGDLPIAAAISADVDATPASGTGALPAPAVTATGDQTVTAPPADGTGDLPNPAVSAGAGVTAPPADGTGDLADPAVTAGSTVTAPPADGTGDLPTPTVAAGASVTSPAADGTGDLVDPTASAGANVTAPAASGTGDLRDPGVQGSVLDPEPDVPTAIVLDAHVATVALDAHAGTVALDSHDRDLALTAHLSTVALDAHVPTVALTAHLSTLTLTAHGNTLELDP